MADIINCTPDRGALRQNFEGLYGGTFEAICEGIDNSIDYRPPCTPENPGTVDIIFVKRGKELVQVVLSDDGYAIGTLEEWAKFLMIKRQMQSNGSSGAYGTGAKSMMDYLSASPIVISHKNEKLMWVNYSDAGDTYDVPVNSEGDKGTGAIKSLWKAFAVDPDKNGTIIIFNELKRHFDIKDVKENLAWKYHSKLKEKNVDIRIGEFNHVKQ